MLIVGSRPHMLAHMEAYVRLIDKYMVCYFIVSSQKLAHN